MYIIFSICVKSKEKYKDQETAQMPTICVKESHTDSNSTDPEL